MPHRIFIAAAANKGREIAVPAEKLRFRHFARAGPLQFFLRLRHAKAWPHSGSLTSPALSLQMCVIRATPMLDATLYTGTPTALITHCHCERLPSRAVRQVQTGKP